VTGPMTSGAPGAGHWGDAFFLSVEAEDPRPLPLEAEEEARGRQDDPRAAPLKPRPAEPRRVSEAEECPPRVEGVGLRILLAITAIELKAAVWRRSVSAWEAELDA
jgi:hypothetical protein